MVKVILWATLPILLGLSGCAVTVPTLGHQEGILNPCPSSPNCVSSAAIGSKHYIQPLRVSGPPSDVKSVLLSVLKDLNATRVKTLEDEYIRAEFSSNIFGFIDDTEFYFPTQAVAKMLIQVRSAARFGYSDFGVNRKRIELIREKLRVISARSN